MKRSHHSLLAHTAALALLLATSCSGGGATGSVDPDLNEGSYSIDEFAYVDENPEDYHPLGEDVFHLSRDEVFAIFPRSDGANRRFLMREDPDNAYAEVGGIVDLFTGLDTPRSAAVGQLDADPHFELIVATLDPLGSNIELHRVEQNLAGSYERSFLFSVASEGWNFADARVSLANVDGDPRHEFVIAARSAPFTQSAQFGRVWVFDDLFDGGAELLDFERIGGHLDIQGLPIDADGDGDQEIVVALSGDTTDAGRFPIRMYNLAEGAANMGLVHGWEYLYSANDYDYSRAVVGDFDSDGREDLAWVGSRRSSSDTFSIRIFSRDPDTSWTQYTNFAFVDFSPPPAYSPRAWAATAFRPSPERVALAVVHPASASQFTYDTLSCDLEGNLGFDGRGSFPRTSGDPSIALTSCDVDADGDDEVQIGMLVYGATSGTLELGYARHEDDSPPEFTWQDPTPLGVEPIGSSLLPQPVLACGDFDADGFALRPTGNRFARLSDPFPIVVLAAPPTKSGIEQNYDDTASSYFTGMTQGTTIGLSTYTSMTYSANAGVDLFGILGVEGRTSIERGIERNQTSTSQVTVVDGYTGSYDADVIIFRGTLYESHEYLIVGSPDPAALGTVLTIDIPHSGLTYKWTVDYYNQQVEPEDRIGTDVLTHTPGDIESYPTRAELIQLTAGEVHWDFDGVVPVGQDGGTISRSVSFGTENATDEQLTVNKGYGGGVSFGLPLGASAGADVDVTNTEGASHGVFYSRETTFEAEIGDMPIPVEYETWRYNWGFSIHTVGRQAQSDNTPEGYAPRKHSFQYLRYWAEPVGSGY